MHIGHELITLFILQTRLYTLPALNGLVWDRSSGAYRIALRRVNAKLKFKDSIIGDL